MALGLRHPGVHIDEVTSGARTIEGVATSIALFVGWAAKGSTTRPVRINSFADYVREFGGLDSRTLLGHAVTHFFANGGSDAYVVRLVDAAADGAVLDPTAATAAFPNAVDAKLISAAEPISDQIPLFNLMCVPGLTDKDTLEKLHTLCRARRAFLLVDSPARQSVEDMETALVNLTPADASNAALFYPWVQARDPLTGAVGTFPPCGFVAGVFARTDRTRGVWKAPAGRDTSLVGALGLERTFSARQSGMLNQQGINCLRTLPVYGTVVWGSRTLQGHDDRASEWKFTHVRRLALFMQESLFRGTQWVVFEPNDEPLWAQIRLSVGAFMHDLFRQGAFQGKSPREAYFVRCDRTTMTEQDIERGSVNIQVGFAPLEPAEFVVLSIQQIAGELAI